MADAPRLPRARGPVWERKIRVLAVWLPRGPRPRHRLAAVRAAPAGRLRRPAGSPVTLAGRSAALAERLRRHARPDALDQVWGTVAAACFGVLLVTGVVLTVAYEPSVEPVVYRGGYAPLRGVTTSRAYASTVHLSLDVPGGLLVRQAHHWAALLLPAALLLQLATTFFTGAGPPPGTAAVGAAGGRPAARPRRRVERLRAARRQPVRHRAADRAGHGAGPPPRRDVARPDPLRRRVPGPHRGEPLRGPPRRPAAGGRARRARPAVAPRLGTTSPSQTAGLPARHRRRRRR